jgi:hypothetical protein
VRASVASSIHEALTLSCQSEDSSVLRETVLTLLKDESPEVMQALCANLDQILRTYASPSTLKQSEVCQLPESFLLPSLLADCSNKRIGTGGTNQDLLKE